MGTKRYVRTNRDGESEQRSKGNAGMCVTAVERDDEVD